MNMETPRQVGRPEVAAVDLMHTAPTVVAGADIAGAASDERIRAFLAFCEALPRLDGLPRRDAADPIALRPWLGYVMVLEPLDGDRDFRYRMYGSNIAATSGFDMTGRQVSAFNSPTGRFFLDCYRRCLREQAPLLTRNVAEHASGMVLWERLMVPFRAANGGLQIVAVNLPLPLARLRELQEIEQGA